jgi:RecB family exonuclease
MHLFTNVPFFCRDDDANLNRYLFWASSIGGFGTCGNPFQAKEKKSRKQAENE